MKTSQGIASSRGPMAGTKPYQVVVWGATGFTGQLVCEHIARDYAGKFTWAMAGRSQQKLEAVRDELTKINPACKDVPILVADGDDAPAVAKVVSQTRVVLATAGPFARYSTKVVEASAELGTHYCDITGEVHYVRSNIVKHEAKARASGAQIVSCCGYDSVPSDLGTLMMVEAMKEKGKVCSEVTTVVQPGKGGASGGTIETIFQFFDLPPDLKKDLDSNAQYLAQGYNKPGPGGHSPNQPIWEPQLKTWAVPFFMEGCNGKIVYASNALLNYSPKFRYWEVMSVSSWFNAFAGSMAGRVVPLVLGIGAIRRAVRGWLPQPGQGPSLELQRTGYWKHELVARSDDGKTVMTGRCGDRRDAGYWSTSRMLLESGLCLLQLEDEKKLREGGVYTPAAACGTPLIGRLKAAGFTFEVDPLQV